jgi:hypothetical protein
LRDITFVTEELAEQLFHQLGGGRGRRYGLASDHGRDNNRTFGLGGTKGRAGRIAPVSRGDGYKGRVIARPTDIFGKRFILFLRRTLEVIRALSPPAFSFQLTRAGKTGAKLSAEDTERNAIGAAG